jgi:hypothetical protein
MKHKFSINRLTLAFASLLLAVGLSSCTNKNEAEKALKDSGYHPIEVGGYGWFDCSEDDMYATKFKAYSPDSSRVVTGCVCQGIFKGKTIRLD